MSTTISRMMRSRRAGRSTGDYGEGCRVWCRGRVQGVVQGEGGGVWCRGRVQGVVQGGGAECGAGCGGCGSKLLPLPVLRDLLACVEAVKRPPPALRLCRRNSPSGSCAAGRASPG